MLQNAGGRSSHPFTRTPIACGRAPRLPIPCTACACASCDLRDQGLRCPSGSCGPPPVVPTVVRDGGALKATRRASFGLWGAAQRTDQRSSPVLKPTLIFWDRGLASAKKVGRGHKGPLCQPPTAPMQASGHGKRSWQAVMARGSCVGSG